MSAVAFVNGLDVISLSLTRTNWGRATLDCRLAESLENSKLEPDGMVSADLAGVQQVFKGQVWRIGRVGGTTQLTALEAKKLDSSIAARFYRTIDAKRVANDILRDAGVTGEVTVSVALETYVRSAGTAIAALNEFCDTTLSTWRTRPDGSVLVQPRTANNPRAKSTLEWGTEILKFDVDTLEYTCSVQPDLYAGMIVGAAPYDEARDVVIERITHSIAGGIVRTCFWGKR